MTDNYNQKLIDEIKDFLYNNSQNYKSLLTDIKRLLKSLKNEVGGEKIYRIYSRKDNRDETDEFKSIEKIAEKLIKWRNKYNKDSEIKDLHDVIGITIVVFYQSDIYDIFDLIKKHCNSSGFKLISYLDSDEKKLYKDFGYYAQHLVLSPINIPNIGLKCEIQIKTLLHDAWHAKTHDLTYKPPGELGQEQIGLMQSFGESIQALEVQSEIIRSLITQHWYEEEELRHSARMHVFKWLKDKKFHNDIITNEYYRILNNIENKREIIRKCSIVDPLLKRFIDDLENLKNSDGGINPAWLLMVCLASIRRDNHLNSLAIDYLSAFLKNQENLESNCRNASFAYYMMGERNNAIKELQTFQRAHKDSTNEFREIKLNLLYYLIEEASYSPHNGRELKNQCDKIISDLKLSETYETAETAAKDTLGYYYIVFGSGRNAIQKGIRLCQDAYKEAKTEGRPGEHYMVLHERIGWRRYLSARS